MGRQFLPWFEPLKPGPSQSQRYPAQKVYMGSSTKKTLLGVYYMGIMAAWYTRPVGAALLAVSLALGALVMYLFVRGMMER